MSVKLYWQRDKLMQTFSHAHTTHSHQSSVLVEIQLLGYRGLGEGCPREFIDNNKPDKAQEYVQSLFEQWINLGSNICALSKMRKKTVYPAFYCAFELAALNWLAAQKGETGQAKMPVMTGVIPITSHVKQRWLYRTYRMLGVPHIKLKVKQDQLGIVEQLNHGINLRLDANNGFETSEACIQALEKYKDKIGYIEEPVPVRDFEGMNAVALALNSKIIVDESFTTIADIKKFDPNIHVLNVRISKLGGLLNALEVVKQASLRGFEMILGCHVGESNVLTRAGIQLWHAGETMGVNWLSNELGLNAWLCGDWKSPYKLTPWRKELMCPSLFDNQAYQNCQF
ncbi:hypothetical protein K6Q96_10535 [Grimontia kaedaensis]|uniref:Mandelate racemase/muconate lactonizing enzyme C-terminal domain-containing protein n=1 Tax=Grimontia kaedaensis TaxID=2872157 RepID=A0ABY4WP43_9GAMM|nr:enolase C-terminal domain-like protein [Grimontia kaedaensis]USH01358.1 hypothetical protein K6Q96_10535 [Grimontia kaedaensis]